MGTQHRRPSVRRSAGVVAVALAVGVVGVSCGGSDGGGEGDGDGDGDAASGSDGPGRGGVISSGLAQIPMAVLDDIDPDDGYEITISDLDGAAQANGVVEPDPEDPDDVVRWLAELTVPTSDGDDANSHIATPFPSYPSFAPRAIDGWDSEFGFSLGEIDTMASFQAFPIAVTVFGGDLGPVTEAFPEVAPGVVTVGEGEDFSSDPQLRTGARPLGRPARLAADDGHVLMSPSTPIASAWGDGETLADDERLSALAAALDGVGALNALIATDDFEIDDDFLLLSADEEMERALTELGDVLPFASVGVGSAVIDDAASVVVAYHFAEPGAAEASMAGLERRWAEGPTLEPDSSMTDLVTFRSIEQDGSVVTVVAEPVDGRSTAIGVSLLFSRDLVFISS